MVKRLPLVEGSAMGSGWDQLFIGCRLSLFSIAKCTQPAAAPDLAEAVFASEVDATGTRSTWGGGRSRLCRLASL